MASQVTVQLTSAMSTQATTAGVSVYAVVFDSSGAAPAFHQITNNGVAGPDYDTGTRKLTIASDTYSSGKIYFLIQSGPFNLTTAITAQSDINWQSAIDNNYRFDSIELNSTGGSFDAANLTDVNSFGIVMSIDNGLTNGTRGYVNTTTGTDIFNAIIAASAPGTNTYNYTAGPLTGQRMTAGPTDATGPNFPTPPAAPFSMNDWSNYVGALKTSNPGITIAGWFNGAPDANNVWHDAGYYSYELTWDGSYFWLKPEANSQIKGSIRFQADGSTGLVNDIYATYGTADIVGPDGKVFLSQMGVGANNQWGAVLRDFLTGFTGGYYGGTGTSPYGTAHGNNIDLSNNANWDPTYLFGMSATNKYGSNAGYDKYAYIFNANSNSYGAGYSDNLTKAQSVGPLLSLWNGSANTNLTVTLFADSDTPSGYQTPVVNNYIAGPYANLTDTAPGGTATYVRANSFNFNFSGSNVFLDSGSTVQVGFYNGSSFKYVSLPSTANSFWNNYTYDQNFNLIGTNTNTPGTITMTGLPVVTSGDVGWYQVVVTGPTGSTKTFNIYAKSDATTHEFMNPGTTGTMLNTAAIDGLAVAQGTSSGTPINGLTFAFLTGSGYSLDPSFLVRNTTVAAIGNATDATYNSPFAPVIGSMSGSAFTNFMATPGVYTVGPTPNAYKMDANGRVNPTSVLAGQATVDGQTVNANLVTYELANSIAKAKIAFSWWGADSTWVQTNANQAGVVLNHDPTSDIIWDGTPGSTSRWNPVNQTQGYVQGQYTNKIGALNTAMIKFIDSDASGTYTKHAPIIVQSNLDGVWSTKNTLFMDGKYKAVLLEYAPDDKSFSFQLNKASDGVVFNIDGTSGGGSITGGSGGISYNGGGDGTWVRLDSTASTLTNGTLFVYFTDSSGNLLDRNDSVTTTLQDAIRAEVGMVKTDGGGLMFNGAQSVYLPTGVVMKFAIQVGNDDIKALPNIQVNGTGTLSVAVSDSSGVLNLSAVMDRSPGPNAGLALPQHEFDRAWVWLTQGESVKVDVAGSAYNNNTLHFVRINTDASDPSNSAGWTVGGVAWGNTDAFRAAVQANWEAGYSASGGRGNFTDSKTFTAGQAGYYAPVLTTEGGDTFVIGATANVDSREHIRTYGQSTFGFEDIKGGDWDYNDLVMKITTT
jgi:hypothetical protein